MGNYRFVILLSCCFRIGLRAQENTLGRYGRPKRIIGGEELIDEDRAESPFLSIRYYTWIGAAHLNTPGKAMWRRIVSCLPDRFFPRFNPERLECEGALIHPKIVQTACRCTANVKVTGKGKATWVDHVILSQWEELTAIFMGSSDVRTFQDPVMTTKFLAHPKCQTLWRPPNYVKYDIGWMLLEDEVPSSRGVTKESWGPIDYAYPYRTTALSELHRRVVAERHVCLIIGHGNPKHEEAPAAPVLKYGWVQLLDYTNCYNVLWESHSFDRLVSSYRTVVSWVCATPLHPLHKHPFLSAEMGSRDSGGPVTCSSNYLFLVSGRTLFNTKYEPKAGFYNVTQLAAIVSAPDANTIESRWDFLRRVLDDQPDYGVPGPSGLRALKHRLDVL